MTPLETLKATLAKSVWSTKNRTTRAKHKKQLHEIEELEKSLLDTQIALVRICRAIRSTNPTPIMWCGSPDQLREMNACRENPVVDAAVAAVRAHIEKNRT